MRNPSVNDPFESSWWLGMELTRKGRETSLTLSQLSRIARVGTSRYQDKSRQKSHVSWCPMEGVSLPVRIAAYAEALKGDSSVK
jgi:hypothetical protein